jgi:uncharacterized protein YecT (DUF1311 family)
MFRPALIALGLLAAPALAHEVDCANTSVQMEPNFCAEQDWQAADAELNRVCKATMATMTAMDRTAELQAPTAY